ncbi:MAG: ABC transporter permease [Acidobacteria bacterium]|nr:ABC transporter permease [Acidobacteriota bacterium]
MKQLRIAAMGVLVAIFSASLAADLLSPHPYGEQYRDAVNAAPSRAFPMGTDDMGRDRLSRLLHACRVSLLLAPAAALVATTLAGLLGGAAGYLGGTADRVFLRLSDLFLSLPWLFLFLSVRSLLPLNAAPAVSAVATFLLLGVLGWAGPARVARACACGLRQSDFVMQAKANGRSPMRLLLVEIVRNLRPVLAAQFWLAIPVFVLAEANLGLLGLGVSEPLPSLGGLLRELENYQAVVSQPWMVAPAIILIGVTGCLHLVLGWEEIRR